MTATLTPSVLETLEAHRGAAVDGLSIGVERRRSHSAIDIASGSRQTTERALAGLTDDDIIRVWITPIGTKQPVWHHVGAIDEVPDLGPLFDVADRPQ